MTEFEKTVIGFFIGWSIVVPIFWIWTNVTLSEIMTGTDMSNFWLERDFKKKFGYTECWKI